MKAAANSDPDRRAPIKGVLFHEAALSDHSQSCSQLGILNKRKRAMIVQPAVPYLGSDSADEKN